MSSRDLLEYANFVALFVLVLDTFLIGRKGFYKQFPTLFALVSLTALEIAATIPLMFFRKYTGLDRVLNYKLFFCIHWSCTGIETLLIIAVVYSVFRSAIAPLPGLHKIGKLVFRWVTVVSALVAVSIAMGPHTAANGDAFLMAFANAVGRIQEGVSVLILCLLLFVCFATKPLGLTYRSRIFGVVLGLGVFATVTLIEAAWIATTQAQNMYSPVYGYSTLGACAAFAIWGVYFALPEPERKMILLPTTSPYHFWNRLSEALGDNPGHVALSGVKLSPVEVTAFRTLKSSSEAIESQQQAVELAAQDKLVDTPVAS